MKSESDEPTIRTCRCDGCGDRTQNAVRYLDDDNEVLATYCPDCELARQNYDIEIAHHPQHRLPETVDGRDDDLERGDGIETDGGQTDGPLSEADEEFLERLEDVEDALARIDRLQDDIDDLDIGLDAEDTRRLLWARMSGWSLSDIETAFDAVDDVQSRDSEDLLIRLLAQLGSMTQEEADEFLAECTRLRTKYEGDR